MSSFASFRSPVMSSLHACRLPRATTDPGASRAASPNASAAKPKPTSRRLSADGLVLSFWVMGSSFFDRSGRSLTTFAEVHRSEPGDGWKLLALRYFNRVRLRRRHRRQLRPGLRCRLGLRSEVEGQLVDLTGELERRIVAILQHRDPGAGVLADVEGLVLRERDRRAVLNGFPGHFLAVHGEHACAALAETRPIRLEVEDDGVLAGAQLRT